MKFSELNKQQKEYLILGVMGVITTIAVLQNLVIAPTRAKAAAARETIGKLESDVRTGESILARDRTNRNRLQTVSGEILERMEREAPPDFSRYTWALGRISRIARQNDIFPQIREFGGQRYMPHRQNYPQIRDKSGMWIPYAIEVDFRTSYTQTMQFLRALHEEDPLASVGQLTIRANPDDPQNHLVNLIIEWPVFRHPEDKEFLTASKGATP
ncbi:MAG: hypothetical protein JJU05_09590 [Verrucomicrobia bacterium]|nr:hypothetical protein [Verrucomicrobiota bacterium]MCH8525997.1 hypothetical protein [Kiritimatiellia bacterium]